ncbi:hypothetical protein C3942_04905 [Solimonas fluminis]|uniref:Uncharacterized protein n=1 Tax=Solimonas fluminis TaxID=2086571 RepID=A0A2S5TJ59_9GAMM|nr:hypothetical protein [Solimonas fluminis]PPE75019.1 hypothetical protein C3942_04905 [Solimonas fluminis]
MTQDACPFEFNFDPATFKVGDTVSYRVPRFMGMPFAATIAAVHEDHIEIVDASEPGRTMRATRESRPVVSDAEAGAA